MDTPGKSRRSRNASVRTECQTGARAGPGAEASKKSGLETSFGRISQAEQRCASGQETSNFFVKPTILDPSEQPAGSIGAWMRDLSFDNDEINQLGLKIELPGPGEARARKLISRSRRVMTGKYPSWKMGSLIHWESRVESKVFRLLDVCPGVARFAEQPFTISYLTSSGWHAHVPDLVLITHDGMPLVLEVKSELDRKIDDANKRAELIAPRLKCLGVNYAVVREAHIKAGASLINAEVLLRFGRRESTAIGEQGVHRLMNEQANLSRVDLVGSVIDGRHAFHSAANLALRGVISLNWCEANDQALRFKKLHDNNKEESVSWLQRALGVIK